MEPQQNSVSSCHSIDSNIPIDVPNKRSEQMSDVEDVETKQRGTLELNEREINERIKNGQELLFPTTITFRKACIRNLLYLILVVVLSMILSIPTILIPSHN